MNEKITIEVETCEKQNPLYALLVALWYNGYEEQVIELYKRLIEFKPKDEYDVFSFSRVEDFMSMNVNAPDRILWSTLVCAYGDYGASPRVGWIEDCKEVEELLFEFVKESEKCLNCDKQDSCNRMCENWEMEY